MFSFLRDLLDALITNKDQPNGDLYSAAEAVSMTADTQLQAAEAGLLDQRVFITVKAT